jgi:hypothetical protein
MLVGRLFYKCWSHYVAFRSTSEGDKETEGIKERKRK